MIYCKVNGLNSNKLVKHNIFNYLPDVIIKNSFLWNKWSQMIWISNKNINNNHSFVVYIEI